MNMQQQPTSHAAPYRPPLGGILPMLAALLCLIVVLFSPEWPLKRTVYHYSFVFDITQSMNTRDVVLNGKNISRLNASKQAVHQALKQLPCGSSVGLGLYTANNTYQLFTPLEICRHYTIIDQVLRHIDWRMAWANDSKIQYGLFAALALLNESDNPPKLVFLSDGDQSPKSERQPAFMGEPGKPGGLIIGVGGETPTPVPHLDEENNITGYWTREEALSDPTVDPIQAQLYLSKRDTHNLKRLAQITGMHYAELSDPAALSDFLQSDNLSVKRVVATDMRGLFAGLCVLFVLISSYRIRRRAFSLIRKKPLSQ